MSGKKEVMKVDLGADGARIISTDYPSNKKGPTKEKKVEKVISGSVKKQKQSVGKKFSEAFLGDNVDNVAAYMIYDVMLPAAKAMVSDAVSTGIEMLLFGEVRGGRTRRDKGKSYVSYTNYYEKDKGRRTTSRGSSRDSVDHRRRARHNFDDICLEHRGEAEEVLSHLVDLTEDYGVATVADMYDLVGVTSSFTDNKYGWDNLSTGRVIRTRDGYLLDLPKPILLD